VVELGPQDEGMKNGHMAAECPLRENIARFGSKYPCWIHGACNLMKEVKDQDEYKRHVFISFQDGTKDKFNFFVDKDSKEVAGSMKFFDKGVLLFRTSWDGLEYILVNIGSVHLFAVKKGWSQI
jgi:hypothetical protein